MSDLRRRGEGWHIEKVNPLEWMRDKFSEDDYSRLTKYFNFKPEGPFQYKRREQITHDGTLMFTHELIGKTLGPLINMESYFKPEGEGEPGKVLMRKYDVGWLYVLTAYGSVSVPAGKIFGEKQRTFLRVACHQIRKQGDKE